MPHKGHHKGGTPKNHHPTGHGKHGGGHIKPPHLGHKGHGKKKH